jgi:hypothetical protein
VRTPDVTEIRAVGLDIKYETDGKRREGHVEFCWRNPFESGRSRSEGRQGQGNNIKMDLGEMDYGDVN